MSTEMRDFGSVMRGMADAQLENVFAGEWIKLDYALSKLVMQDFLEAAEDDDVTAREYQRRIGKGNLESYARCMKVRAERGWDGDAPQRGNYRKES